MTSRLATQQSWWWQLPAGGVLALATAWSVATTKPPLVPVTLGGVLLGFAILRRPELGALLIVVLVAIVPRATLFDRGLPLGGGNLKVTDLLLLITMVSWAAGRVVRPDRFALPRRSLILIVLLFLALALVGVITARNMGTPLKLSLVELRPLLSYLLIFPMISGIRNLRNAYIGLGVVLAACAVGAFTGIWQYARGEGSAASFADGASRITNFVFIYQLVGLVVSVVLLGWLRGRRERFAVMALAGLCFVSLFFTFFRGAWIAAGGALLLTLVLLRSRQRFRVGVAAALAIGVGIALVLALNAFSIHGTGDPLAAAGARIKSIGASKDPSGSFRFSEWRESGHEIAANPVGGIGLGSSITFFSPLYSPETNTVGSTYSEYYIHNSFIWIALKLGLVAAAVFLSLLVATGRLALRLRRGSSNPGVRCLSTCVLVGGTALVIAALTGPQLTVDYATPLVAGLIALAEALNRISLRSGAAQFQRAERSSA